jgi:predicted amidohydrolase YtcJ
MFAESYLGKIKPGYMADFTVLSQDLSTIDPAQIPSVNVHFTIVNGKVVYKR